MYFQQEQKKTPHGSEQEKEGDNKRQKTAKEKATVGIDGCRAHSQKKMYYCTLATLKSLK
jgi:hypothetical protein